MQQADISTIEKSADRILKGIALTILAGALFAFTWWGSGFMPATLGLIFLTSAAIAAITLWTLGTILIMAGSSLLSARRSPATINIIGIMVALASTVLPLGLLWMILQAEWMP